MMKRMRTRLATLGLFVLVLPAFAADEWLRLTTPHFEVYAVSSGKATGEKKGRDALLYFEQVRSLMMEAAHANWDQVVPVRIIIFPSEKQFRAYAPAGAFASYSAASRSRDCIVMQDATAEYLPVAIQEYAHFVLQHSGLKLPAWLNEGWADVFSTLKPAGDNALVGAALKDDAQNLKSAKWLDFNTLTSVDEKSPAYNDKTRAGVFYAESWAFVHMLYLGRDYRENFGKMLTALNEGKSAAEACQIAYGRTAAQVYADLQTYTRQNSFTAATFPARLEKPAAEAVLSPVSDMESGVLLADALAAANKREQAKTAYENLAKQYPGAWEVAESLGYLAWQGGDGELARKYFEEALPGTKDPQMCYNLASLYHDSGQGGDKLLAALGKAVSLKPDYTEARLQLGLTQVNLKNYPAAITTLSPVTRIMPEHAAVFYNALAYAYAQTGDFAAARRNLENARQWAKTDAEKQQADQLGQFLDGK